VWGSVSDGVFDHGSSRENLAFRILDELDWLHRDSCSLRKAHDDEDWLSPRAKGRLVRRGLLVEACRQGLRLPGPSSDRYCLRHET
jgi:hypothetical protein